MFLLKLFNYFKNKFSNLQTRKAKIVFLGLDNAGKTSLLRRLKDGRFIQNDPTLYAYNEEIKIGNISCKAIDMGGHEAMRKVWKDYVHNIDAIFYIVDSSNPDNFATSREELFKILGFVNDDLPIAILGNKIDRDQAVSMEEMEAVLSMEKVR